MRRILSDPEEIRSIVEQEGGYPVLISNTEYEEDIPKVEILHIAYEGDGGSMMDWSDFFTRLNDEGMVVAAYDDSLSRPRFSIVTKSESTFFENDNTPEDRQLPDSGDEHVQKENIHTTEPPEGEPEV